MQFVCRVGTSGGRIVEDVFEATDEATLRQQLTQRGYHIFDVRRRGPIGRLRIPSRSRETNRIGFRELTIFNQELAALLRSGLPMLQALDLMLERQKEPVFRSTLSEVRDRVKSGEDLSSAIDAFGDMFPPLYAATLKAGESSGEMEQVIRRFIRYLQLVTETRKRIVSALVYPAALVGLSVALIGVMTIWVMPRFTDFFSSLRVDLPLLTRITMGLSVFVKEHFLLLVIVVVTLVLVVLNMSRTEAGRNAISRAQLRVPLLGPVFHRLALSEFCRSLATLLAGGIPIVSGLEVAVGAVSNSYFRQRLEPMIDGVREGQSLATSLEETGVGSDIVIDMVEVGEATGSLDTMLSDVSDFLDEEVETSLQRLLSLLEPVMLVLMGIIVATLLISVYLPLFSLLGQVQG
jgi:type IV pilus assembly protein PilC